MSEGEEPDGQKGCCFGVVFIACIVLALSPIGPTLIGIGFCIIFSMLILWFFIFLPLSILKNGFDSLWEVFRK